MPHDHPAHDPPADFPGLEYLSDLSELALSPPEAHGIFCGLLCSGARDPLARWLEEILPRTATTDSDTDHCRAVLTRLAEQTQHALQQPGVGFAPLLPQTDAELAARAEGVHDWSRGFLFGLGLNGCDPNTFAGETREAIEDLTELTRMDLNDLQETEDNEQALAEIIEFLWVAAMLVFEDRGRASAR